MTFCPDENLPARVDLKEVEANQLGAASLIPRGLVQEEIRRHDLNLDDEGAIRLLAKEFNVNEPAVSNRCLFADAPFRNRSTLITACGAKPLRQDPRVCSAGRQFPPASIQLVHRDLSSY